MLFVAERHPLKQGLKQIYYALGASRSLVAERHPLKQGLKLYLQRSHLAYRGRRAASTKTRIET